MTTTDKRKRSLYFPDNILKEMQVEAKRQERSLSWIVQYAWRIARNDLMRLPSVGEPGYNANLVDTKDDDADVSEDHPSPHGSSGNNPSHFGHHNS